MRSTHPHTKLILVNISFPAAKFAKIWRWSLTSIYLRGEESLLHDVGNHLPFFFFLLNLSHKTPNLHRSHKCSYWFQKKKKNTMCRFVWPISVPKFTHRKPVFINYRHQQYKVWRIFTVRELFYFTFFNTYLKNSCIFLQQLLLCITSGPQSKWC